VKNARKIFFNGFNSLLFFVNHNPTAPPSRRKFRRKNRQTLFQGQIRDNRIMNRRGQVLQNRRKVIFSGGNAMQMDHQASKHNGQRNSTLVSGFGDLLLNQVRWFR
jgi:hypothetical protein